MPILARLWAVFVLGDVAVGGGTFLLVGNTVAGPAFAPDVGVGRLDRDGQSFCLQDGAEQKGQDAVA